MYSQEGTLSSSRSPCALRWQSSGSGRPQRRRLQPQLQPQPRRWTPTATMCREREDALVGLLSKFEFDCETEEVTAEEKLLLREACKKTKLG